MDMLLTLCLNIQPVLSKYFFRADQTTKHVYKYHTDTILVAEEFEINDGILIST